MFHVKPVLPVAQSASGFASQPIEVMIVEAAPKEVLSSLPVEASPLGELQDTQE